MADRRIHGGGRSPLLMWLAGLANKPNDLSGVKFEDTITPGALNADQTLQAVNYGKEAVPTHWWNQGKANNINNQIALQGVLGNQSGAIANKFALDLDKARIPLGVEKIKGEGAATTDVLANRANVLDPLEVKKLAAIGDDNVLHKANLLSDQKEMYRTATTIPRITNIVQELNSGTQGFIDKDVANQHNLAGLARARELGDSTRSSLLGAAINNARTAEEMSKLQSTPKAISTAFDLEQQDKKASVLVKEAQAKALDMYRLPPKSDAVSLTDPNKILHGPKGMIQQIEEDARQRLAAQEKANPTTGNIVKDPPVVKPDGTIDVIGGLSGEWRKGEFIPYPKTKGKR